MKIDGLNILRNNQRISIRKCAKAEDKCNSMIRTKKVDYAWQDMQYGKLDTKSAA